VNRTATALAIICLVPGRRKGRCHNRTVQITVRMELPRGAADLRRRDIDRLVRRIGEEEKEAGNSSALQPGGSKIREQSKVLTAALKRCATQKPQSDGVFPQPVQTRALLKTLAREQLISPRGQSALLCLSLLLP
jgi:hypothetical protein